MKLSKFIKTLTNIYHAQGDIEVYVLDADFDARKSASVMPEVVIDDFDKKHLLIRKDVGYEFVDEYGL